MFKSEINSYDRRLKTWVRLVKEGANSPDHPLHTSVYLPLSQWLEDNKPSEEEDNDG
jgi:hypothetical protein